jgi:drug/metabolite transporter (DMT)-like permease
MIGVELLGDGLAFGSAVGFALMTVLVAKGIKAGGGDPLVVTLACNLVLLTPLTVILAMTGGVAVVNGAGIALFAAAGISNMLLARLSLFASIRRVGASRATAMKHLTPAFTLVLAIAFLHERLRSLALLGALLVVCALFMLLFDAFATARQTTTRDEGSVPEYPQGMIAIPGRRVFGLALGGTAALLLSIGQILRKTGVELMPQPIVGALIGAWAGAVVAAVALSARRGLTRVLGPNIRHPRPQFVLAGLAGTAAPILFLTALQYAPVSKVAVIGATEVILTVAFGTLLVGGDDTLTRRILLPAALVTGGVALIALS